MFDFALTDEDKEFRARVRAHIENAMRPELLQRQGMAVSQGRVDFITELAQENWIGLGWPPEYGGVPASGLARIIVNEELARVGAPNIGIGLSVGEALLKHGTEAQRSHYIPKILRNEIMFAYGYTEPSGGSDLAALRTTAIRDGEHYIVNGEKMFITPAHYANYLWTAVRTDPNQSRHAGISILLIPLDAPGVNIRELQTLGGWRTNEVRLVDVSVGRDGLVGRENEGWPVIRDALNVERLYAHSPLRRTMQQLVAWALTPSSSGGTPWNDSQVRYRIARLAVRLEAAHVLFAAQVEAMGGVDDMTVPAAMNKLFNTEYEVDLLNEFVELAGVSALIARGSDDSLLDGVIEEDLRGTILGPIAGGSSEVQLNLIARHGLGLVAGPKSTL